MKSKKDIKATIIIQGITIIITALILIFFHLKESKAQEVKFGQPIYQGQYVSLPLLFDNILNMGSFSLRCSYDSTKFEYITTTPDSILVKEGVFMASGINCLNIGWFSTGFNSVTISNPCVITLRQLGGCTDLLWDTIPAYLFFSDWFGNEIIVSHVDGYLCSYSVGIPEINDNKKMIRRKFNLLGQEVK